MRVAGTGRQRPGRRGRCSERPPLPPSIRAPDAASAFQIGPEDILDISVWKNPELSRIVPVRPDGKVSLPLVNDIQAAGLTPATLRKQVTERLSEFIPAPEVSVMVREVHSRKVAVVGAVKTPGRFELKSPMTVLEVIALAQGFTDFAARDRDRGAPAERRDDDPHAVQLPEDRRRRRAGKLPREARRHRRRSVGGFDAA